MCDLDLFVESPIVLLLSCGWPSHFVLMNCFEDRSPLTPFLVLDVSYFGFHPKGIGGTFDW